MKKILFCAFESLPFIKTGGLADVVYALPKAIDKNKYEVKVVLPLLKKIKDRFIDRLEYINSFEVHSGYINEYARVYKYVPEVNEDIAEYLFIDNDTFFNREEVYGYDDDCSRFCFFNVAVLEMMIQNNYYPDILHTHDYHTGVLPALCKYRYNNNVNIAKIKHIFTIHNLVYQGIYDKQVLFDLLAFDYKYYENGILRFNDCCNFMKIAIECADIVTTVSKTYSYEIQGEQYGEGLDAILRYRSNDLYGIVNGIDLDIWNPKTDKLFKNYSLGNCFKGKSENKLAIQKELGLKEDENAFVVAMVSRLTFQKGAELLAKTYSRMLHKNVQIIVLGTGESKYEYTFRTMENNYKGQAVFYCGYNEQLAHSIYAGSDLLLMPSLFEPCGISQLIAMHYGTLPLVRETGGLKDTVEPYNCYDKLGRGFSFKPYNEEDFYNVFEYAYQTYRKYNKDWRMLVKNAMNYDVSFKKSALEYQQLYKKLINK